MSDPYCECKDWQIAWANERSIPLQGSKGPRGVPAYTLTVDENLFNGLSPTTRRELEAGDGDELRSNGFTCKMQAVHSSAALTVNLFDYWRDKKDCDPLIRALGLSAESMTLIEFEAKRPIMDDPNRRIFRKDPNLDTVIALPSSNDLREVGFECKFTEPFRPIKPENKGLSRAYLREEQLWEQIPNCHKLAGGISPSDNEFTYLHAAQLLKHILGLKHRNGLTGFRLAYVWYDVPGVEGDTHRSELDRFRRTVTEDGISFQTLTFQDLIESLRQRGTGHEEYVDYLVTRYLD